MTEEQLDKILNTVNIKEDQPELIWFVDTINDLVAELRRVKALYNL